MNGGKWQLGNQWNKLDTFKINFSVPVGKAPTGSMGNNGAVTLGTALDTTYANGIYLYFPVNAISAGSAAGFYWTVMSSTTVGVVYNNTFDGAMPSVPASNVEFATTGPGAFTGDTTTLTALSFTIPGGSLGTQGSLFVDYASINNNSGGAKVIASKIASSTFHSQSLTTNTASRPQYRVFPQGVQSAVKDSPGTAPISGTATAIDYATIDMSADQSFSITINTAVATDWAVLSSGHFEIEYA